MRGSLPASLVGFVLFWCNEPCGHMAQTQTAVQLYHALTLAHPRHAGRSTWVRRQGPRGTHKAGCSCPTAASMNLLTEPSTPDSPLLTLLSGLPLHPLPLMLSQEDVCSLQQALVHPCAFRDFGFSPCKPWLRLEITPLHQPLADRRPVIVARYRQNQTNHRVGDDG